MSSWWPKPPVNIPATYEAKDEIGIDLAALFLMIFERHCDPSIRSLAKDVLYHFNTIGYGFMHWVTYFVEYYAEVCPEEEVHRRPQRVIGRPPRGGFL